MKKLISAFVFIGILVFSYTNTNIKAQQKKQDLLTAKEFSNQLSKDKSIQLVDVRTAEEFAEGHLNNAENIDWNSMDFGKNTAFLDKKKPVFVYCLSGGRSEKAAEKLRKSGFSKVYNLDGGMMKWRAANLPEVRGLANNTGGMNTGEYEKRIGENPVLLVDFYADWCEPCKRMKPYLEEMDKTMKDKVTVLRINVDKNKNLVKQLGVDALPVLMLYKNKSLVWKEQGFVPKETVMKKLAEK